MLQSMGSRRVRHNRATNQQQLLSPLLMFEIFPILMGQRFPSPQKLKVPATNFPTSLVLRECACDLESARHLFLDGFPGGSDGKIICLQCWRPGFNPWVRKIPWRRDWQPTPVFLPRKFHGWRVHGITESDTTEQLRFHFHFQAPLPQVTN